MSRNSLMLAAFGLLVGPVLAVAQPRPDDEVDDPVFEDLRGVYGEPEAGEQPSPCIRDRTG